MDVTWVALAASLMMGLGAAGVFVAAVRSDYFRDLEDAKYQVFWSDLHELVDQATGVGRRWQQSRKPRLRRRPRKPRWTAGACSPGSAASA